ncbi:MAG TPA: NADH-quinone oxidoreductase subunit M [Gammaproteobacteria bacterium]|nr:NADH-quinone oxidoreductase subunit M [Gammaproteobacteria bacterium]
MILDNALLSWIVWLPILGGAMVLLVNNDTMARPLSLLIAIATLILSIILYHDFDSSKVTMQFVEQLSWIPIYQIQYYLGVDGFSVPLIILTTLTTVIVIIAGWEVIQTRVSEYMAAFLIMSGLMIGVFTALDAILFYLFFEAMLIPLFLVIGIWGGPNRRYATIKFFLYTFFGSVFLLLALLYLGYKANSFYIIDFYSVSLTLQEQVFLFIAFLLAFAVKIPMWPVHTWLPDAHVEAPTGGSVILAAVTLKIGGYGLLRFALPITPDAAMLLDGLVIGLSLIAIVYIGFVALVQTDMKKLIAYSSIAHMGFVTLGLFVIFDIDKYGGTATALAVEGAMIQMISHGFIAAALFLCVGVLYERRGSRDISAYGGVMTSMPIFSAFAVFFAMANAGLPGTSGFVGEFMVILATIQANFWYAFLAASTLILGAAYSLWMVKRVIFGEAEQQEVMNLSDINQREFGLLGGVAFIVLLLGVWPAPLTEIMHSSVVHWVEHVMQSKL